MGVSRGSGLFSLPVPAALKAGVGCPCRSRHLEFPIVSGTNVKPQPVYRLCNRNDPRYLNRRYHRRVTNRTAATIVKAYWPACLLLLLAEDT